MFVLLFIMYYSLLLFFSIIAYTTCKEYKAVDDVNIDQYR